MQSFICDTFYPSFGADLLTGTLGAFLGIVGAYFLYLLSIKQLRRDRLKYVASLIESIVPSALRQSKFCSEHAEAIVQRPFENIFLKLEANRNSKRLADKVDQEGVYHAYLWQYKRNRKTYKEFQNLYAHIDYLDYSNDDMLKVNERILNGIWERKKQYQITFKRVQESIQTFSLIPDLIKQQPVLIQYSGALLEQFYDKGQEGENLTNSYTIVVEPLKKYIIEKAEQHPKVTEVLFLLNDLSDHYKGIELSAKHNAEDYKLYAKQLKEKADQLLEISKQLREDFSTKNRDE